MVDATCLALCVGVILLMDKCVTESVFWWIFIDYEIYLFIRIWRCGYIKLFLFLCGWNNPSHISPIIIHLCKIVQSGVIVTVVPSCQVSAPRDEINCNNHCFFIIEWLGIIWNSIPLNISLKSNSIVFYNPQYQWYLTEPPSSWMHFCWYILS